MLTFYTTNPYATKDMLQQTDGGTGRRTDRRADGRTGGRADGQAGGRTGGRAGGRTDGQTPDGQTPDGQTNKQTERTNIWASGQTGGQAGWTGKGRVDRERSGGRANTEEIKHILESTSQYLFVALYWMTRTLHFVFSIVWQVFRFPLELKFSPLLKHQNVIVDNLYPLRFLNYRLYPGHFFL